MNRLHSPIQILFLVLIQRGSVYEPPSHPLSRLRPDLQGSAADLHCLAEVSSGFCTTLPSSTIGFLVADPLSVFPRVLYTP
ncbi:hypothetical protein CRENBAI_017202 [Crenichthys baileyi]|uniref:Secreted protein n=1 Tax=Crenichthys baileyi TaxID=28760 RepID=A0AAV9RJD6_9TELE